MAEKTDKKAHVLVVLRKTKWQKKQIKKLMC